jgi:hypothetical protein
MACPKCGVSNARHVCALNVQLQESIAWHDKRRLEQAVTRREEIKAVPRACDPHVHLQIKQSGDAFLFGTWGWQLRLRVRDLTSCRATVTADGRG